MKTLISLRVCDWFGQRNKRGKLKKKKKKKRIWVYTLYVAIDIRHVNNKTKKREREGRRVINLIFPCFCL